MDSLRAAISQGPGLVIFRIIIFILLAYVLYSLYKWLSSDITDVKDSVVYTSPNAGLPANSTDVVKYNGSNVPEIYTGGEFSVSTWIYVNNWSVNSEKNKIFLTLSGGDPSTTSGFKTLILYLGANVNKLGVRLSYYNKNNLSNNKLTQSVIDSGIISKTQTPASIYSDTSGTINNGDIEKVNLQKWVNITIAVSGTTVDVYIDGKLSRSSVLEGIYEVDSGNKTTLELAGPNGFGGYIGQTRIANFAYSPDQVYKNYLSGPFDNSLWATLLSQINPSQYSFNIKRDGKDVLTGSSS